MRDREVIEKEIYQAREDLESSLAELKHAVAEKVDVKARARIALAKGKIAAEDALERGKVIAHDVLEKGKTMSADLARKGKDKAADAYDAAKERPALVAGIPGGLVAAGVLVYVGRRKDWW
jgi:hypothetical protein